MKLSLGVKTDCIETRYSFEWLFDLMAEEGIPFVQVGSFYELYWLEDSWFLDLRRKAEERGLTIKSVFTAHRELGGFFVRDPRMAAAARLGYEKLIHSASLLGADYVGSNPGAVHRDDFGYKEEGIQTYLSHMRELSRFAKGKTIKALTIEPMSCLAEPPTTPEEIARFCQELNHPEEGGVPVWLCGDISHGHSGAEGRIIHDHEELFRAALPWMCEFHIKNTDSRYGSTFGFGPDEQGKGIVSLARLRQLIKEADGSWPVDSVVGYLEIMGPKIGRDWSDPGLGDSLRDSLRAIQDSFSDLL